MGWRLHPRTLAQGGELGHDAKPLQLFSFGDAMFPPPFAGDPSDGSQVKQLAPWHTRTLSASPVHEASGLPSTPPPGRSVVPWTTQPAPLASRRSVTDVTVEPAVQRTTPSHASVMRCPSAEVASKEASCVSILPTAAPGRRHNVRIASREGHRGGGALRELRGHHRFVWRNSSSSVKKHSGPPHPRGAQRRPRTSRLLSPLSRV